MTRHTTRSGSGSVSMMRDKGYMSLRALVGRLTVAVLAVLALGAAGTSMAAAQDPPLEIADLSARVLDEGGQDYTVAGGHPFDAMTHFWIPAAGNEQRIKSVFTELPAGFVGNVAGAKRCTMQQISPPGSEATPACPAGSQVGTLGLATLPEQNGVPDGGYPLYNMVPERGYPAQFAFNFVGLGIIVLYPQLRPRTGQYGVTVSSPGVSGIGITGVTASLFGVPSLRNGLGGAPIPFVSNPADCLQARPSTRLLVDAWVFPGRLLDPGASDFGSPDLTDPNWKTATAIAPPVTGCDAPGLVAQFQPTMDMRPTAGTGTSQADAPSGYTVDLEFPQAANDPTDSSSPADPSVPSAPPLKDATVTLPEGVAVSPSAADGLDGCTDTGAGDQVHYDTTDPVTCPAGSKIGSVVATSPLLAERDPQTDEVIGADPVGGSVFVVKPHPGDLDPNDGRDGLFRLLIELDSREHGVNVKIPGVVIANRHTGRLTARFEDNPQLPAKSLRLSFKPGPRAALANPAACTTATTTGVFTPWSRGGTRSDGVEVAGTPDATSSSSFDVSWDGNGAGCPAMLPFAPGVNAGLVDVQGGGSSPFVFDLTRGDRQDVIDGLDVSLPGGLLGAVRNVELCSDAAANAGSCPAASRVGSATVAAGPGANPFYLRDQPVSLTGPYKGAPYGLAVAVHAAAGPFDLGTVVVRQALHVDPNTAQVTVKSDPLPTIRDGVPFRVRRVHVVTDRPGFMRSPTSCKAKTIETSVSSAGGQTANLSTPLRATGCSKLGFKPKLALALTGKQQTKTGKHPGLKATVAQRSGEAGIQKAEVRLPKSLALDPSNAQALCEFADGTKDDLENHCPKGSIVGRARATSPLLKKPLSGNVYFVKNVRTDPKTGNQIRTLPMIIVALRGEIDINLRGVSSTTRDGKLVNTFDNVPDAPVSKFNLNINGGNTGILAVTRTRKGKIDLCSGRHIAEADFDGHNSRQSDLDIGMRTPCTKRQTKAAKRAARRAANRR
jgi:hypothetical protein